MWSETGYAKGAKQGVLAGAGNSLSGPVTLLMPPGWTGMRSEPAGTNKGHQLVWLDKLKMGRMLEFWVNPSGPKLGNVGEVWLSGASFWQTAGYKIKMGNSSDGSRAYVVR